MEFYTAEIGAGIFSTLSLVDDNELRLLTRDTPVPSDLVVVTAAVSASQM